MEGQKKKKNNKWEGKKSYRVNTFLHNSNSDFSWFDNNVRWVLDIANVRAVVPELHVWYSDRSIFLVKISSPSDPVFKWYVLSRVWLSIRVIEKLQSRKRGYKNNPISNYGATVLLSQHSPRANCVIHSQQLRFFSSCLTTSVCLVASWSHNHACTSIIPAQETASFSFLLVLICFVVGSVGVWFFFCFADKEVGGKRKKPGNLVIIKE